jgi:hypothetical protein
MSVDFITCPNCDDLISSLNYHMHLSECLINDQIKCNHCNKSYRHIELKKHSCSLKSGPLIFCMFCCQKYEPEYYVKHVTICHACPVCLEYNPQPRKALECGHQLCIDCANKLTKRSNKTFYSTFIFCPICRGRSRKFINLFYNWVYLLVFLDDFYFFNFFSTFFIFFFIFFFECLLV